MTVILSFREDLISRNFANAKFCENKTLAKISEFTVQSSDCDTFFFTNELSHFLDIFTFKVNRKWDHKLVMKNSITTIEM